MTESTPVTGSTIAKDPNLLPQGWTELDSRAVDTVRVLAADAVHPPSAGHPGTAMSLAPVAYLLFQKVMRHDPTDTHWVGRDRFVLSAGHSCLTLYIQLYLGGFGLELDDIKDLRTWGSRTPGHPEYGHTDGVEVTTGPLGQGIGNAVGMAMAARRERGLLDPDAVPGSSPFDHQIYCIASDGDIEEGVSSEASSLAGTQRLGNLTLIYDNNRISIEDDTSIALSEDTAARYEAYGWHVQTVDWTNNGTHYAENVKALLEAIEAARLVTDRPSFIDLRTIIAWPAPNKQNTGAAHGSVLGDDEVRATKAVLGFDPEQTYEVTDEVLFGDIWRQPDLSPRDRSVITCSSLISLYRVNELPYHLKIALDNGVTKTEIIAMITHLAFYSGWPTAATALSIANKAFADAGV